MAFPDPTNIGVIQNATFEMTVSWMTGDATPAPISLDGYRARMQIRTKVGGSGTLLLDLTSDTDSLSIEPDGHVGQINIRIGAEDTGLLTKALYYYDLFIISEDDSGEATRLVYGTVALYKSVTLTPVFVP